MKNSAASVSRQLLVLGFPSASVLREGQDQINRDSTLSRRCVSTLFFFFSCVHGGFVIDLLCCCLPSHPHVLSLFFWYFLILYQAATFFVIVFWPSQDKLFCFACQVDRKQLAAVTCSILSLCLRLSSRASSSSAPPRRPANSHRSFRIGRRHGAVRVASSQSLIQSPLESR